jgi:hypothetical protein
MPNNKPVFFQTVDEKKDILPEVSPTSREIVKARLGRILSKKPLEKNTPESGVTKNHQQKGQSSLEKKGGELKAVPPSKSIFKPRHIIGIIIYIGAAQFATPVLESLFKGHDAIITTIAGFAITDTILLYVAFLIIFLIVLAQFDLIPSGKRPQHSPINKSSKPLSNINKQGVQGEDDTLYKEFRLQQKKARKK